MSQPSNLVLQIHENMLVWYRVQQMSHHHEFKSFFSENVNSDAKMMIPTNPESHCSHNTCQNNLNSIITTSYQSPDRNLSLKEQINSAENYMPEGKCGAHYTYIKFCFLEAGRLLLIPQPMSSTQSYCKIAAGLCPSLTVDLLKLEPSPQQLTTACLSKERGKECVITSTFCIFFHFVLRSSIYFIVILHTKGFFCSSGTVVPKKYPQLIFIFLLDPFSLWKA